MNAWMNERLDERPIERKEPNALVMFTSSMSI